MTNPSSAQSDPKRLTPKTLIFLTIFMDLLGFGIIIPILPVISATFLPLTSQGMGAAALMTAFSLLQMLFSPLWGRLSDRHGRRPILLVSLFGSTASYLLFAFSRDFTWLLLSRVFAGICGANITAAQAYIADITSHKDRTAGMGLVGMAFGLGFALAPFVGGGATRLWMLTGWATPENMHQGAGLVAAAICGINFVWAAFSLPESLPPERRGKVSFQRFASTREALATLRHPVLGALILLFFLVTFAFANLEMSFSLYAVRALGLNLEGVYGMFVYVGVVMALVQGGLVRQMVRYVPEPVLIVAGTVLLTLGLILLPLRPSVAWVLAAMTILALGQGMANPPILSLISRGAGEQLQGNVLGTAQSASALARVVGPIFGGLVFDFWGTRWPFWAAAAVMAISVGWAITTRRRILRQPLPMKPPAETLVAEPGV